MIAIIIASAVLGLGTALFYWIKVSSIPLTHGIESKEEAERLIKITRAIELGAMAFLKAEYKTTNQQYHIFTFKHERI